MRRRVMLAGLLLLAGALGCQPPAGIWSLFADQSTAASATALPATTARDASDTLRIHFLDVGQGDAVLIEAPTGQRVLIDAGPDASVVDQLRRLGVDGLDLFIASHNHADHIGGAAAVLRAFPVRYFMDNGVPHTTAAYRNMLAAVAERDVPLLEPEHRTISLGDVVLEILPPPGDPSLDHNDNSIGVVLAYGEFRATFAGDAEDRLWRHWLARMRDALPQGVDVHKASHHGSRAGDHREALRRLKPELVVVSLAADNPYGHPHAEALALYREVGARVLLTADAGTITVAALPDGTFHVRTARESTSARTRAPPHGDERRPRERRDLDAGADGYGVWRFDVVASLATSSPTALRILRRRRGSKARWNLKYRTPGRRSG